MTAKAPRVSGPPLRNRVEISTSRLSDATKNSTASALHNQSKRSQRCGRARLSSDHHQAFLGGFKLLRQSAKLILFAIVSACFFRRPSSSITCRRDGVESRVVSLRAVQTASRATRVSRTCWGSACGATSSIAASAVAYRSRALSSLGTLIALVLITSQAPPGPRRVFRIGGNKSSAIYERLTLADSIRSVAHNPSGRALDVMVPCEAVFR